MTTDADNAVFELDNANNTTPSLNAVTISSTPANLVASATTLPTTTETNKQITMN